MRKQSRTIALAGAIATAFAFTAVPSQIIFASAANAEVQNAREAGPKNDTYWFRNADGTSGHRKVDVWGHSVEN
jgi:hypothetical protein